MATPTLGNTPTTINAADSITGWTFASVGLEPDVKKEGTNSLYGILRNDLATVAYSGASTDMTGQHVRMWINFQAVPYLDTEANSGMEFFMTGGGNTAYWVAFGSDTYGGGWENVVIDADSTPDSGTFTKTAVTGWGFRFNRTGAPRNADNTLVDYLRYGDGYYATGGTTGDRIELGDIFAVDDANGYGMLEEREGVFFSFGDIVIGNGATTTWFDMVGDIMVFTDSRVASTLYGLSGVGSGCRVNVEGAVLKGGGTTDNTRFTIDMSDSGLLSCTFIDNLIVRANTSAFKSGQTVTGNTFDGCGQITHGGADMSDCSIGGYAGAANTAALVYNETANPQTTTGGMSFTRNGSDDNHAIEFGLSSPTTITLDAVEFNGYGTTSGEALRFLRTSGTVTVNLINGTTNVSGSYTTAGATIVFVANPVAVTVNTVTGAGSPIEGARVLLKASDGTGPLPYQDSVTITSATTTASVAHTGHGMSNGDYVEIKGANEAPYNGVFAISNVTTNAYDYTMGSDPAGSAATGTITATGVIINKDTTAAGVATETRSFATDQPVEGRARKGTTSPLYKTAPLSGIVSSTSGLSITTVMIPDE